MQKTLLALTAIFTLVPSLPILTTQPVPIIIAIPILLALFLHAVLHADSFKPIMPSAWPTALLVIAVTFTTLFIHQPIPTFLNSGWNTLLTPLTQTGLLPLITPLAMLFTVWTLRTTGHPWPQVNRLMLCLFTCLLMWPDGAADLPALGLLILSLTLLLTRQRISWPELAACILLLTAAATARAIFIYVPALIAFSLFAVWPKRALTVLASTSALLYILQPTLPTLPAINLSTLDPLILTPLILLTIVAIQSIYHWRWWPAPQHAAWGLGAPMLVIALANLAETPSLSQWYGANYLMPALPVILHSLLRPNYKS